MEANLLSMRFPHESELFENQKGWMRPKEVSSILGIPVPTIYDWKYRAEKKNVPKDLFVKLNGQIFIRKKVLLTWICSQNF